jgi:drug/metabolite transporter (DMT)-like permease
MPTNPDINRPMGATEWFLLITLSVLWGGTFFCSEVALDEVQPSTLVMGRVGIAALALLAAVHASGHRMARDASLWIAFLVMGVLNNLLPFSLIFWGQLEIAGGLASILIATTPLFTVSLAHFLTRDERSTPSRLAGLLLGVAGIVVMIGPEALRGLGLDLLAQLAVLGAALSYAFAGIYGRRFRGQPPLVTAAGQVSASTLMMLPVALLHAPWDGPLPGATTWAAIFGIAILGTALAYILYFRILASAGATNLLLVTFLIPVSALVLGIGVLGERMAPGHLAGMALIALGLAAIDGRPFAWLARPRQPARPAQLRP